MNHRPPLRECCCERAPCTALLSACRQHDAGSGGNGRQPDGTGSLHESEAWRRGYPHPIRCREHRCNTDASHPRVSQSERSNHQNVRLWLDGRIQRHTGKVHRFPCSRSHLKQSFIPGPTQPSKEDVLHQICGKRRFITFSPTAPITAERSTRTMDRWGSTGWRRRSPNTST